MNRFFLISYWIGLGFDSQLCMYNKCVNAMVLVKRSFHQPGTALFSTRTQHGRQNRRPNNLTKNSLLVTE